MDLTLFSLDLKPFSLPSELSSAGRGGFLRRSAPRAAKSWFGRVLIECGLHLAMTNMHLLGSTSHLDFERLEKGIIKSTKQSMIKKKKTVLRNKGRNALLLAEGDCAY